MNDTLKFLGIPGSLRQSSYNRSALLATKALLPEGATLEIFELDGIPLFNQDHEKQLDEKVVEFKRRIREADAIVFATPEYNYSIPGVLKNAIDYASRPYGESAWSGKPVAVIGASVSDFGTARAQYHLRQMFVTLNMHSVNQPEVTIGNAEKAFDKEGKLIDSDSQKLIRDLMRNLDVLTRQLKKNIK